MQQARWLGSPPIPRQFGLNGWMQGVAVFVLVLDGNVDWNYGAPMAIGGLVGGYIGGSVASREPDRCSLDRYGNRFCRVRHYFWKLYGQSVIPLGGYRGLRENFLCSPLISHIFYNAGARV